MNITTLLLLSFSVVSCVGFEDVSSEPLTLFDPMETEGAFSQYDEPGDVEPLPDLPPIDEDIDTDIDEVDDEDTPPGEFFESEIKDANRLSCPFSGKSCRFKKAKCSCSSKDGDFKFTIKKFGMVDPKTEGSESGSEEKGQGEGQATPEQQAQSDEQPMFQQQEPEPSPKEIAQEVPEMIEGFQMLEQLNDPSQVVLDEPSESADSQVSYADSGLEVAPSTVGKGEFEDKTIRVRTEDKKDKNKKVHEYEYLRVKKVDKKNGVKETHLESPESENPSVSYHKGAIPKMDYSVKSKLSTIIPPKADEEAKGPIEAIEYASPLAIEYASAADVPAVLTPAEKIQKKLAEIEQRRLASQSQYPPIPAYYNKEMGLKTYEPVVIQGLKKPVGPPTPKYVSLSYPGGVTDLTSGQFSDGAQARSLKKKKSKKSKKGKKPKKTKQEKLAEKEKKKELKKKKKLMKEYTEKNDNTIMEKMKERDRILAEKLEKEKEELEKKQEAGAVIAKRVKQLQIEKDKQEKKIRLAEKQIQAKKDRERKVEKVEKLKQIKKEKKLLREQEKQLDQMKGDSIDDEIEPVGGSQLLEKV